MPAVWLLGLPLHPGARLLAGTRPSLPQKLSPPPLPSRPSWGSPPLVPAHSSPGLPPDIDAAQGVSARAVVPSQGCPQALWSPFGPLALGHPLGSQGMGEERRGGCPVLFSTVPDQTTTDPGGIQCWQSPKRQGCTSKGDSLAPAGCLGRMQEDQHMVVEQRLQPLLWTPGATGSTAWTGSLEEPLASASSLSSHEGHGARVPTRSGNITLAKCHWQKHS